MGPHLSPVLGSKVIDVVSLPLGQAAGRLGNKISEHSVAVKENESDTSTAVTRTRTLFTFKKPCANQCCGSVGSVINWSPGSEPYRYFFIKDSIKFDKSVQCIITFNDKPVLLYL